jgi:nucleoside triphosphate pyrophosphatase
MIKLNKNSRLILASKSPRRRDLLEQAGLEFSVIPSCLDESSIPLSSPESYVKCLAEAKAQDISQRYPDSWIIGADTMVIIENTMLGKPGSRPEARKMLRSLSGKTHQVLTGYCICCEASYRQFSETIKTDVCVKELTEPQIEWYINSGEPFDKAGAYAIQGIGTFLVKRISGSYTNVVGLPVCEVMEYLINAKVVELTAGKPDPDTP